MKIIVISFILISVTVSAQQKEKKLPIPSDTLKQNKFDRQDKRIQPEDPQKKMYKMPAAKPDASAYSSLKDKRKDTIDYKILNAVIPQKHFDSK
jgi:hypothetical protein